MLAVPQNKRRTSNSNDKWQLVMRRNVNRPCETKLLAELKMKLLFELVMMLLESKQPLLLKW
jgi:hypothetical protein